MGDFEEKLQSILGDQRAMDQIMALARSLSGEQKGEAPPPETPEEKQPEGREAAAPPPPDLSQLLGEVDPRMVQAGLEILRQVHSTDDRNAALLNALRPFLREERRPRLDRALQLARMTRMIRVAIGVLGGKEGADRV